MNRHTVRNRRYGFLLALVLLGLPHSASADPGNDYCVTPAFITASIKPNLLLLLDNSASMYDLSFVDKGLKHCAIETTKTCQYDSDCATTGDRCSVFDRQPYYCYDETYSNANTYTGYFDPTTYYYYRSGATNFSEGDFAVLANFANGCPGASGETVKSIPNTMCVQYVASTGTLTRFAAKGNYLNWLTASKLDIEKKILTGGKWDGAGIIAESRGCVGQGYVKSALAGDFVNFAGTADNDNNIPLGVTFTISGPGNTLNPSAPSTGGTSYINLFAGNAYRYSDCQNAVNALATGGNADIKQTVASCLTSASPTGGFCQQLTTQSCTTSTDCVYNSAKSQTGFVCTLNTGLSCTGTSDNSTCKPAAQNVCSLKNSLSCTGATDTASCKIDTVAKMGTCGTWSPNLPQGLVNKVPTSCSAPCSYTYKGTTYSASCIGYTAASSTDYGPCTNIAPNYGSCVANYTGPCVLPASAAVVKTKVSFQQSMQACWQLRNGKAIGTDDINTVNQQCSDVYGSFKTCSNNHLQTCSIDADCGTGNTCQGGPQAIAPGNPALLCGATYEGQYYTQNSSGAWVLSSSATTADMIATHTQFCNDMATPNVTDPTDAPSDTTVADNLPAIISGVGVEAQVGPPIGKMRVKLATATPPAGLVQQFGNQIRLGAMSFNQFGSATEKSLSGLASALATKVCSGTSQVCTSNTDCANKSCVDAGTGNLDGGKVIYPIGRGICSTMTGAACLVDSDCSSGSCLSNYCGTKGTTVCTTVNNCSGSNQACIPDDVGAHGAGTLTRAIDDVVANTWTPLAEAYYNAIGYYAQIPSGSDAGKSRTALRLNAFSTTSTVFDGTSAPPIDFNESLNPSEYRCQQNYTLLISDGSSTADRNTTVSGLASLYASQAGISQVACTGASSGSSADYGGNNNVAIMSWIAKNRNIATFSLSGSASTAAPANARDSFTSYVVFNGEANGASGDCNSLTLLTKTAANGGTTLKLASKPEDLKAALTSVFTDVAAKAASGTAASILSNSEGSGANIMQAVFYPKKIFDNQTAANWIGEMQNLWYYIDPYINNSTIREDSDGDLKLNLVNDNVVRFTFDTASNRTMVQLFKDSDGNGTGDVTVGGLVDPDQVKSIWRAGKLLWSRDLSASPRTIYTPALSGGTAVSGTGLMKFSWSSPDNSGVLQPYLQAADNSDAQKIMKYVHGFDFPGDSTMRSRTVQIGSIPAATVSTDAASAYVTNPRDKGIGVWKLGDIITSTPRVQSTVRIGTYNLTAPGGYNDQSYRYFVESNQYQNRGMVYVGANDGMLHAFNLGVLSVKPSGFTKATLSGTNLGREEWAFIPKQFLPYLKYSQDPAYQHLYAVDGRTLLVDASIGDITGCTKDDYWTCDKPTNLKVTTAAGNLDPNLNTWRTIVIGGMGLGGASSASSSTNKVTTPTTDPADTSKALGYSSYFALDITDPANPQLLWEFSNPDLGFATSGPAIVRLGGPQKNGRWFAIFGSGPTGPIDTVSHQFLGRSNQNLKYFVVDLRTGALIKTIDTGLQNAFSGSLIGGAIDTDRWDTTTTGNYQDDAVYTGYVKKASSGNSWTDGGVGRILIDPVSDPTDANVANAWHWSKILDGIGPVTVAVAKLQDKKNRNLWLYAGTGRYYFRDSIALDDYSGSRMIFGLKEPCYNKGNIGNYINHQANCTDQLSGSLVNQTSSISSLSSGDPGWRIDLDANTTSAGAERLVTDTVALINGTVYFTTFEPTMDACGYGGNSFLWGVKYDTGDAPPSRALTGKALIQLSTGEFKEVDLATAFTDKLYRRMAQPLTGKPPSDAPPIISSSSNKPVKKILHIQEH
ncbi:hypothetical protein GMST_03860 [Geomonas silvestris]|uniref:Uncharacterized protein n=1 Tax=Geomonas silvestris TaxID=2740184 RepID=A0A6V8MDL1_9BACT|nr:PilC/PilY family type IV pilus protein [Geomonas silvestris]GFO58061.1 hypothetical protein GMST_03860 [Geomonas silvestris]